MAIRSYSDLVASIGDWLNRGDLAAVIPTFISLAEARFNADPRGRLQKSLVVATALAQGPYVGLPVDYLQMQNLRVPDSKAHPDGLELVTAQQIGKLRYRFQSPGEPQYYAVIGTQIQLLPEPDQDYTLEMQYFVRLPALSGSSPSNWLLVDHPEVYLYGSLVHAEPYLKNDDRVAVWKALYDAAMDDLNTMDDRAMFSGSTLKMRTRSFG